MKTALGHEREWEKKQQHTYKPKYEPWLAVKTMKHYPIAQWGDPQKKPTHTRARQRKRERANERTNQSENKYM